MNEGQFVNLHFKNFYERAAIEMQNIEKREFGFGFKKKIDFRHKSFSKVSELKSYLVANVPLFTSYSTALYEFPWATPMERKVFQGADLVFDLDNTYANEKHEGNLQHQNFLCSYCLKRVAQDALCLIEEYILGDFGFSTKDVTVNFSGSKGFHVHVKNEKIRELSHDARRAIADYVTGKNLSLENVFPKRSSSKSAPRSGPTLKSKGWMGKVMQTAMQVTIAKNAEKLKIAQMGNWSVFSQRQLEKILLSAIHSRAVQVDAPCTFDLHRLIRLTGTLHGDSALIAKAIPVSELQSFNPLIRAAPFSYGQKIKVKLAEPFEYIFCAEEDVKILKTKELQEVPLQIALSLICKGKATLG